MIALGNASHKQVEGHLIREMPLVPGPRRHEFVNQQDGALTVTTGRLANGTSGRRQQLVVDVFERNVAPVSRTKNRTAQILNSTKLLRPGLGKQGVERVRKLVGSCFSKWLVGFRFDGDNKLTVLVVGHYDQIAIPGVATGCIKGEAHLWLSLPTPNLSKPSSAFERLSNFFREVVARREPRSGKF